MATAAKESRDRKAAASPGARDSTAPTFAFSLARTPLLEALQRAATGGPKRLTTLPILATVLVRVRMSGELSLTCSSLDETVETCVAAVTSGTGAVALPAKRLIEVVGALPTSVSVEIAVTGRRAKLVAGRSKFEVIGMPAEEFPNVEPPDGETLASIPGAELVAALQRVAAHASTEQSRPALNAVLLEAEANGKTFIVGCDGYSLGRTVVTLEQRSAPLVGRYSIPRGAVGTIAKLFGADERVTISGTAQQLRIVGANAVLTFRLVGDPYPEYRQFLKYDAKAFAIVDRAALLAATRRVAIAAEQQQLEFQFSASALVLSAQSADTGAGEESLDAAFTAGDLPEPFGLRINSANVVAGLESLLGDQVRIEISGNQSPIYFRNAADTSNDCVATTLPLRDIGGA